MALAAANHHAGLVAFGSAALLLLDLRRPTLVYRDFLDLMVALDAAAFLVFYISETQCPCPAFKIRLVADLLWCIKDAAKYAYITDHTLALCNAPSHGLDLAAFSLSALVYLVYIIMTYIVPTCDSPARTNDIPALIALYTLWLAISLCSLSALAIRACTLARSHNRILGPRNRALGVQLLQAIGVMAVVVCLNAAAAAMSVARYSGALAPDAQCVALLFVYSQMILYVSHDRGVLRGIYEARGD